MECRGVSVQQQYPSVPSYESYGHAYASINCVQGQGEAPGELRLQTQESVVNNSSLTAAKGSAFPGKERVLFSRFSGTVSSPQSDERRELFNKTANSVATLVRLFGAWNSAALHRHSRTERGKLVFCTPNSVPGPNGDSAFPCGNTGVAKNPRNHSARVLTLR